MSQHHITITGRITQEPSLRRVAGGNCVLDMRVASSRAVRDDDRLIFVSPAKTTQHLLIFTSLGNVIYRPVHELSDIRWKTP